MTTEATGRRRDPRPWLVPPASIRTTRHALRGAEILHELPGPLGILLWLLHRDVELWAGVEPCQRAGLFRMAALRPFETIPLPEALAEPVRVLCAVLAGVEPDHAASACSAVAAWAGSAAPQTALLFAEARAQVEPRSPGAAREVAAAALRCGLPDDCESWLRRAVALARRGRDWAACARARLDLAELFESQGDPLRACLHFRSGELLCRRRSLAREIRARAAAGLSRTCPCENPAQGAGDHASSTYRFDPERRVLRGAFLPFTQPTATP